MVRSSAAALKSFLPPSGSASPFGLLDFGFGQKGEGDVGGGGFLSLLFRKIRKAKGPLYRPFRTVNTNFFLCGLSNLSNQAGITDFASPGISKKPAALNCLLLLSQWRGGAPLSRHPLAFHASWYYRLFIQPLFKLDADRVALDMCIAEKKTKQKQKNINDGHFKDKCLIILFLEGVKRGRMIGFGTEMMLFSFCFSFF